jgi:hypothetical protein
MKKIIRLTESDLTRLVKRVIKEQQQRVLIDVDGIPCIKRDFTFPVYKIVDRKVLSKFQGASKPVLSKSNYIVFDMTNMSYPEKKFGVATIFSNGQNVGSFSLDGTTLGEELTDVMEKVYADQGNKPKIGWVFCNGQLYIYDMVGESTK